MHAYCEGFSVAQTTGSAEESPDPHHAKNEFKQINMKTMTAEANIVDDRDTKRSSR